MDTGKEVSIFTFRKDEIHRRQLANQRWQTLVTRDAAGSSGELWRAPESSSSTLPLDPKLWRSEGDTPSSGGCHVGNA
eukprot:scaffold158527_cov17-Tisochrysis_lutea.AAC.2